jgi:two-component system, OmpR family, sensor histidine kinase VicK
VDTNQIPHDTRLSLTIEVNDDTAPTTKEAIGLATYSNSESTVLSYVSVFETLWTQTELKTRNVI